MAGRLRVLSLALSAALLVAGCGGANSVPPPVLTKLDTGQLKAKGMALIVVSGVVVMEALWTTHPKLDMTFALLKADGQPDIFKTVSTQGASEPGTPFIAEVPAGDHVLVSFSWSANGGKYTNAAGLLGIAPARFKVSAGDVVYLGHVKVMPEKSIVVQPKPKITMALENHEGAARAYLTASQPGLAPLMKHQALTIMPGLLAAR
jgi:hypothetical protein